MTGDKYRPVYEFAGKLIPQLVEESARRDPERPALMVHRGGGKVDKISYAQLWDKVVRLGSFIQRSGINPGEHIALLGTNSPEWAITYLAIQSAGCVVVPLDSAQRPQELRHIIRHSDSVAIFLAKKFEDVLTEDGEDAFPEMSKFFLESHLYFVHKLL